jgi:putative heme-binding domain-containing protein
LDDRKAFFAFLRQAGQSKGGNSFDGFLKDIDQETFANATDAERLAIEAIGARKPFVAPSLPKPQGPGQDWTMEEVLRLAETGMQKRDYENGKKMFAAARCVVCHRFNGDGGATGPDLTLLAGRFTAKDVTESIIEPSKVIGDQYRAWSVTTSNGQTFNGAIVADNGDKIVILTNPEDSTKIVEVRKQDIEEQKPSPISLMPVGLLRPLNEREVLDLMAYLLSRGDAKDPMFRK